MAFYQQRGKIDGISEIPSGSGCFSMIAFIVFIILLSI